MPANNPRGSTALLALLLVGFSPASAAEKPWSEKAILQHVDAEKYEGILSEDSLNKLISLGKHLFETKFTSRDGIGRPHATGAIIPTARKRAPATPFGRIAGPESNACGSCHNEPVLGGAGNFTTNVFVSEGFTSQGDDSTDPQFSNERNTNHIMGAGLIELLAREMSADLALIRKNLLARARKSGKVETVALITKGVSFGTLSAAPDGLVDLSGLEGIDTDLVIRPFSQKGVMTSLRQFTINALNAHHGMQAVERYGARWTGTKDFDGDGVENEITPGDVSALVAFQATLPAPTVMKPENGQWQQAAAKGKVLFGQIGCTGCHIEALPLKSLKFADPGPMDAAGTLRQGETSLNATYDLALFDWAKALPRNDKGEAMVPLLGDLKRHRMTDAEVAGLGNELLSQRFVERDVFMTGELWGIGSTAPYGHRGDMTLLSEVIEAHGGEARQSRDAYLALDAGTRETIIAYLKTLVIEK